ncbi:unnamed protein product [Aphanomyces euteiches]|uniref:Oxidation resistance protein 1 n=1 Tax=Aphanomyces euteiches TaxID=100861 RepID=A0A6G0XQ92_9STRA|nr:hypothetical protein Ae201684_002384 [Aphanomyces euteiches]KAH9154209.1 hypothetical protein AeRB84_003650 [Aphanomyces euteiches]
MLSRIAAWLVPSAAPGDDENSKKRYELLAQLKKAVMDVCNWYEEKNKLDFQGKRPLEEEDIGMHDLLLCIQSCLQHGLRDDATSFWIVLNFIQTTLTDPTEPICLAIKEASEGSQTDNGKCRYWVRTALNRFLVEPTITAAISPTNESFIRATYDDHALLRCSEAATIMVQLLSYLRELSFNLQLSDREFSRRRTSLPKVVSNVLHAHGVDLLFEKVEALVDDVASQAEEYMSTRARALSDRQKGIKPWQHVFNVELSFLVRNPYHTRYAFINPYLAVPNFLIECLDYLQLNASTPRLFRTTVSQVYVTPVKDYIETHGNLPKQLDPHVASTILIEFLRHIPEPLITSERYDAFISSSRMTDPADRVRNLTCLVADLPVEYKVTMELVFGALAKFLTHSEENGLNIGTLSIALAPAIVRKRETRENKTQMQSQEVRMAAIGAHVVELLVEHHETIFQPVREMIVKAKEEFTKKQEFLNTFAIMVKQPVEADDPTLVAIWSCMTKYQHAVANTSNNNGEPLDKIELWHSFGFREAHIVDNFQSGGQLMARCVAYFLENDETACQLMVQRLNEYNMPVAFAALVMVLLNVLKLAPTPQQPVLDFTILSMEPFWEIFDEKDFFLRLFGLSVRVFDHNWTVGSRADFGRILEETEAQMAWLLQRSPSSFDDIVDDWVLYRKQATTKAATMIEESIAIQNQFTAKLIGTSSILSGANLSELNEVLPITCQLCKWKLLFSNEVHGSSLNSLLMLCKGQSPTLLVLKEDNRTIFGGFASDVWHTSANYYGNGESFIFRFTPLGKLEKYSWSRKNNYFQLCNEESLVMGGGNSFGLYLDADLVHGTTGKCDTYSSEPLVPGENFACTHVEVWGYTMEG